MSEGPLEYDDMENREESEVLDQLQPDDTLVDRGVDDVLDEGYSPPEKYGPGEGFGTTADEALEGETLEQRVAQEEPDVDPYADVDPETVLDEGVASEVGDQRSGRLVEGPAWRTCSVPLSQWCPRMTSRGPAGTRSRAPPPTRP